MYLLVKLLRSCISTDICTQHRPNLEDEKSPTKIEINAFHLYTTISNLKKKNRFWEDTGN